MSRHTVRGTWDDAICEGFSEPQLYVQGIDFSQGLPEAFAKLPSGCEVFLRDCKVGPLPEAAKAGEGKLKLTFEYCSGKFAALKKDALLNGTGRVEITVYGSSGRRDKAWGYIRSLGNDGVGDPELRQWAFDLRSKGAKALTPPVRVAHLQLMTFSAKPVRMAALEFLEAGWPNPMAQAPEKAAFFLAGKPTYHAAKELKERIKACGHKVVTKPEKASYALLLDQPKDKLGRALEAELPIALEKHLKEHLDAAEGPAAPLSEAQEGRLADLLLDKDPKTVAWALGMLGGVELTTEVLTSLVLAMMFSPEAKNRKAAKLHLLGHAPEVVVNRFRTDRRQYASLADGGKLRKLALEMERLGLNGPQFALGLLHCICVQRANSYLSDEVLTVVLQWPETLEQAFRSLSGLRQVYLPRMKGSFWPHMRELTECRELRVGGGKHTNTDHMDELLAMPNFEKLEYWVSPARLELLAPLAGKLEGLEARGAPSELRSVEPLSNFEKLKMLSIGHTEVADLSPLAGLPLVNLQVPETKVADLSVLRELPDLQYLNISRCPVTDLEPLRSLSKLRGLNISHIAVEDWSVLANLPELETLDLWAQAIDFADFPVMPKLTRLHMPWCKVTNLSALGQQPALRYVSATRMDTDPAEVAAFRAANPQCQLSV